MGSAFPPDASAAVAVDDSDAGWAARAREVLAQADARLARRYGPDADIDRLLALRARAVDELLRQAWHRCLPAGAPLALFAVGGYGRGELFPHSDVDVLVLLPDALPGGLTPDQPGPLKQAIEAFITACWDIGLEIGSSVRTVRECLDEAAGDVTIQTALLESRWLAGSRPLVKRFDKAFREAVDPRAFMRAKTLEMRQRHTKYEETPYALEPNCKESPGGLRDLQMILWVAKAAGLGRSWDELARTGLATPLEARQIKANEALLSLIRARLHLIARRREDRLVFDLQTAVAESFGFKPQLPAPGESKPAALRAVDDTADSEDEADGEETSAAAPETESGPARIVPAAKVPSEPAEGAKPDVEEDERPAAGDAQVVSLDAFRKKS